MLRLASLLWRLRRATIMETGLFEIQVREKVLKSAGKQRSAELVADFENKLAAKFAFDYEPRRLLGKGEDRINY